MEFLIKWGRILWEWIHFYLLIVGEWCVKLVNATFGWYIGREFSFNEANMIVWGGLILVGIVALVARYLFSAKFRH